MKTHNQICPVCSLVFDFPALLHERYCTSLMIAPGLWIQIYPCTPCYEKLMNSEFYDGDSLESWYLGLITRYLI